MLQGLVPLSGGRQEDRDRLLRFDIYLNVTAVPGRVIRRSRMVVRGVQPHTLVVAGLPIENSLLAKRRRGQCTHQQKRKKERHFDVSHSTSIFGAAPPCPQASRANLSPGSILTNGTGNPAFRSRGPKKAAQWSKQKGAAGNQLRPSKTSPL